MNSLRDLGNFATVASTDRSVEYVVDRLLEKPHAGVAEEEIDAAGMLALVPASDRPWPGGVATVRKPSCFRRLGKRQGPLAGVLKRVASCDGRYANVKPHLKKLKESWCILARCDAYHCPVIRSLRVELLSAFTNSS